MTNLQLFFKCILIVSCHLILSSQLLAQWSKVVTTANFSTALAIDAADTNTILIAGNSYPVFREGLIITRDGGKSFSYFENLTQLDRSITDVSVGDREHFWFATSEKIFASSDGGNSWEVQYYDTSATDFINYIKMFDKNNGVAMGDAKSVTSLTLILKTTDGGKNWIQVNTNLVGAVCVDLWRRIDFVDMNIGYLYASRVANPGIMKTVDGGKTWSSIESPAGTMVLKFYNEKIGVNCAYSSSHNATGIFTTHDGGKTWPYFTPITGGWGSDFEFIPGDPSKIWFTNMNTLFYSADTGKTWNHKPLPYSQAKLRDIEFINAKIGWVISDGSLFLKSISGGLVVGVERVELMPNEFHLHQNYPNPFNPETSISYQISAVSHVTLKVYDVLGREVATLVNEVQQPGIHNVKFTINNKHFSLSTHYSTLATGIYFYRLQAGDFVQTKKMVLLR